MVQVAVDTMDLRAAEAQIRTATAAGATRIELGRPLIESAGFTGLPVLAALASTAQIVLDTMILAAPSRYLAAARDLGAGVLTVSALAPDATVAGAVREAERAGVEMVVDLFNVADPARRARECVALGARSVMVHFGVDQEAVTTEHERITLLDQVVRAVPAAVSYAAYGAEEAVAAARTGACVVVQGESAVSLSVEALAAHLGRIRATPGPSSPPHRSQVTGRHHPMKENHP